MAQSTSGRVSNMSIPTDLSATQATQPNKDIIPTLSSFMRMQAQFYPHDLFQSPLLLYTELDRDFQSNATNILRPAASYAPLNGLGIRYHDPSGYIKVEDVTHQDPDLAVTSKDLMIGPSNGEHSFH